MKWNKLTILISVFLSLGLGAYMLNAQEGDPLVPLEIERVSDGVEMPAFSESETAVAAPLGTAFTYQGSLKDNGVPANGLHDFLFFLYAVENDGVPLGGESPHLSVPVTDGLFTLPLQFPFEAFTGEARWLEIFVRRADATEYQLLSPRVALNPTPYAQALPGLYTQQNNTSPNVIGGHIENNIAENVVGAVISGGGNPNWLNCGTGQPCVNQVTGDFGTVSGGFGNTGWDNSTVSGGGDNYAGYFDVVGGGYRNNISGAFSFVGGGNSNTVEGDFSSVPGGYYNDALGNGSFAAGTRAKANHHGSFVWADPTDDDFASTAPNQFAVRAAGGMRLVQGASTFASTSAALQVENAAASGEAAWFKLLDSNNPQAVQALVKPNTSNNNFLEGYHDGFGRKFHINNDGTYVAGSDFAEALPAAGTLDQFEPGDVLVISVDQPGAVMKSRGAFDTAVIGVYSTRPGILGADKDGMTEVADDDIPVAIVGIVPVKVSAENGPIQPGDMLTTAAISGHAMFAGDDPPQGSVVGKAMGVLTSGTGVIKMLVMLQ